MLDQPLAADEPQPTERTHPAILGLAGAIGVAILASFAWPYVEANIPWRRPPSSPPGDHDHDHGPFPRAKMEREALRESFRGISTDGQIVRDLFPIQATSATTEPARAAAEAFLAALTAEQRGSTVFPVDDLEWRDWTPAHRRHRKGVNFRGMTEPQRAAALALVRASLSERGAQTVADVMMLDRAPGDPPDYPGEPDLGLDFLNIMGTPSATEPWGWQLDGHHLAINYFVLGDQVVMTPTFLGAEPAVVDSGKHQGTAVLQAEQDKALAFFNTLAEPQQRRATIAAAKRNRDNLAEAFRDNLVLGYAGIRATEFDAAQRARFLDLIAEYVGYLDDGHARAKLAEVEAHLADTYFAWVGRHDADSVFYYRVQSPVLLIEFDHQGPELPGPSHDPAAGPTRQHIHALIRTPNGNDYGKELLRQYQEQLPHAH